MKAVLYYAESTNSYCMFEHGQDPQDAKLEDDAVLVATFDAETWEDARAAQYKFLGWEDYVPFSERTAT